MERGGGYGIVTSGSGKENVEQQENAMSEHEVKVREARNARRKRILARSSERLAYITSAAVGEAKSSSSPAPLCNSSPLLDKSNSFSSSSFHPEGGVAADWSAVSRTPSSDQESTIKKTYFTDEFKEWKPCESHQKHAITSYASSEINRENTSKEEVTTIAQLSKSTVTMEAQQQEAHESMNENQQAQEPMSEKPLTFKGKLSCCIQCSLLPRFLCATFAALIVLVAGFTQGGPLWPAGALSMIYFPIALSMGAFFILTGRERMNLKKVNVAILPILMQLLLTILLDCSIFGALVYGGFLILPKYFPGYSHIFVSDLSSR